jgi:pantetheine-phosphate adenylyltransferase
MALLVLVHLEVHRVAAEAGVEEVVAVQDNMSTRLHQVIGLGGTFDHFHIGHQFFLEFAANLANEVRVGVTTQELTLQKAFADQIESQQVRQENVTHFLQEKNIHGETFSLTDLFGPTLENSQIDAIAVTEMTKRGGEKINEERRKRGLSELPMYVCELLKDETGEFISSTRIRAGEIDRQGKVYAQVFKNDLILNPTQREFFKARQGKIVQAPSQKFSHLYVVGDIVLETFLKNNWRYNLGIYDQKNNRQNYTSAHLAQLQPSQKLQNSAGSITLKLVNLLQVSLKHSLNNILIDGEEDLSAVALVLLAPLGSAIYYGQPNEGMVEVIVTEELKEKFYNVLRS